jgi:CRP-like cAMP-binding protein
MMALLSGSVPISVPSPDGKEIVLAILQPRDIFGLIALLDRKERCAAVEA